MMSRTLKVALNGAVALSRRQQKFTCTHISKRKILSVSYVRNAATLMEKRDANKQEKKEQISTVCLLIDRCSDKQQPYSSITIDRMINAIEDKEDIKTSMYYLYKFRHGDTCYFLRPWTTHTWIKKCIACNEVDLVLQALNENVHYGIFPDEFAFNFLIDHCLKKQDYSKAFDFASHMFLSEKLQSRVSQVLALATLFHFTDGCIQWETLSQKLSETDQKRNFGGVCYRLGQLMNVSSLQIIGLAILGFIERESGIRAVYQEPWGPLVWKEGYLREALSVLTSAEDSVSEEALKMLGDIAEGDDEIIKQLNETTSKLKSENLINTSQSFSNLVEKITSELEEAEKSDLESFSETVREWHAEDGEIRKLEKEIFDEWRLERERVYAEEKIKKTARQMAVEKLGYWELLSEDVQNEKELHLREDYVEGSISDIEIERRRVTDEKYFYETN